MTLETGTRLGPYEIVGTLGAGGMGEVYRARDTRLGRSVAIKVLPSAVANDVKLRARFEREAKAVSALNHPHICTLHDVGRENGIDFLVMEHCEGKTLARQIADGALPISKVIDYGIQIADALTKAHQQGIIHRDLKPSNVIITKSGVKVLDFGLAKQQPDLTPHDSTVEHVTESGTLLGTVQYMAPELLTGKDADARSDIFALGLILYEMTTGRAPFAATSRAELIAAIFEREPEPVARLNPAAPGGLARLIGACIAKSADDRMQNAHDVMLELKWIGESDAGQQRRRTVWPATTAAFALGALITAGIAALMLLRKLPRVESTGVRRLAITLPEEAPITPREMGGNLFTISRDGKRLAYIGPQLALYVRSLDSLAVNVLPGTEGASNLFFSPDGKWIGFEAARKLKKVSVAGGNPMTICEGVSVRGAVWRDDDTIVFGQAEAPPMRVSASGGAPQPLSSSTAVRWPAALPGTDELLVTLYDKSANADKHELALLSAGGQLRTIVRSASHGQYISTGHLLFLRSGSVYRVPFDTRTKAISGAPEPVLHDVAVFAAQGFAHFAVGGRNVYYVPHNPAVNDRQLLWVDRRGNAASVTEKRQNYAGAVQLSPDGKQVLVDICARDECDIWTYDIERSDWNRVTSDGHSVRGCWSPDGRLIAYASNRDGPYNIHMIRSDGSDQPRRMTSGEAWSFPSSWSPDGKFIAVFEGGRPAGSGDISLRQLADGKRIPYLETPAVEVRPEFSPDGRWLAYMSSDAGSTQEVFIRAADGTGARWKVSEGGGIVPRWRGDGKELFYKRDRSMMSVTVGNVSDFRLGKPSVLFQGDFAFEYDVTRDGQRFLMVSAPAVTPRTHINAIEGLP